MVNERDFHASYSGMVAGRGHIFCSDGLRIERHRAHAEPPRCRAYLHCLRLSTHHASVCGAAGRRAALGCARAVVLRAPLDAVADMDGRRSQAEATRIVTLAQP